MACSLDSNQTPRMSSADSHSRAQAKFAWPRHMQMNSSKQFADTPRPRLHVTGAIIHGFCRLVYVTESDSKKDSNLTAEVLADILGRLHHEGVDLSRAVLTIQADNTCRETKNNYIFRLAGFLVGGRRVKECICSFLTTGSELFNK